MLPFSIPFYAPVHTYHLLLLCYKLNLGLGKPQASHCDAQGAAKWVAAGPWEQSQYLAECTRSYNVLT